MSRDLSAHESQYRERSANTALRAGDGEVAEGRPNRLAEAINKGVLAFYRGLSVFPLASKASTFACHVVPSVNSILETLKMLFFNAPTHCP